MPPPRFTPRLLIRRIVSQDCQDLHELHGDPQATTFIGGPWPIEKTRDVVTAIAGSPPSKEYEWFAVTDPQTARVLGVCWLHPLNPKWCEALGITQPIELGYRYARRYWGNGYATEAAHAMVRRGFEELNLPEIAAIVDIRNQASERVLQKLGMKHRGDATRDGVRIRYYAIAKGQFS